MIAKLYKYDFVLYARRSEEFLERLRALGLVDVTAEGWEPSEEDRRLISSIEGYQKAVEALGALRADAARFDSGARPYATAGEAYESYVSVRSEAAALQAEIVRLEKAAEELRPWGAFDAALLAELARRGVALRFFMAQATVFDKNAAEWSAARTIEEVHRTESTVWFVAVTRPGDEVALDAQEVKAPVQTADEAEAERRADEERLASLDGALSRAAATLPLLEAELGRLKERLQGVKIVASAEKAADDTLLVMRGWAEADRAKEVDALLDEFPGVVYLKGDPAPDEDTPVKLTNNRFARIFELVGDMYARPRYGTIDLTPFFAPFYMLFFGICLNDAGYGLVLLAMGAAMLAKFREKGPMRRAAWFATLCAVSTTLFGLFCGSFFGLSLGEYFPSIPFFDFQGKFFSWALAIGVVQILFGLVLKVAMVSATFGVRYALSTLGWFLVLLSGSVAVGLPMLDPAWAIPGFGVSSPAFCGAAGLGLLLMLFFNSPGRNPLVNLGSGLWETYNNITGILSDVLSYIRLFAIGLSGGILATVFNDLAVGLSPDIPVLREVCVVLILFVGHGINLFMSTISSFVHPMRLTFVEFYKNAGFEMAPRAFDPLRKQTNANQ